MATKPPIGPQIQIQKVSAIRTTNGLSVIIRPMTIGVTNCASNRLTAR